MIDFFIKRENLDKKTGIKGRWYEETLGEDGQGARPGTDISQSLERDPTCRHLISDAGGQNCEGYILRPEATLCEGACHGTRRRLTLSGAVFAKSQNTVPPHPGTSTPTIGVEVFQRHFATWKRLCNHQACLLMRQERAEKRGRGKNWGLGKTGKIWKERGKGCSRWGNHVSKDRHGEMQMSFSNESDVV